MILCEKTTDKNAHICELSMQMMTDIIKTVKENMGLKLSETAMTMMFKTIAKNLDGKRATMMRMSEECLKQLM